MKIFLDTADIEEIRTAARWGVLDGVTTNPICTPRSAARTTRSSRRSAGSPPARCRPRSSRTTSTGCSKRAGATPRSPEHRGEGRDERERPRGDEPVRRRGDPDQLHADLHAEPGAAGGEGRREPHLAVRRPARRHQPGRDDRHPRVGRDFAIHDIDAEILSASIRNPLHVTQSALAGAHIATCRSRSFSRWSITR